MTWEIPSAVWSILLSAFLLAAHFRDSIPRETIAVDGLGGLDMATPVVLSYRMDSRYGQYLYGERNPKGAVCTEVCFHVHTYIMIQCILQYLVQRYLQLSSQIIRYNLTHFRVSTDHEFYSSQSNRRGI